MLRFANTVTYFDVLIHEIAHSIRPEPMAEDLVFFLKKGIPSVYCEVPFFHFDTSEEFMLINQAFTKGR